MTERRTLTGPFVVLNDAFLRERAAETDDRRSRFYQAVLDNETFNAYFAAAGSEKVTTGTRKKDPTGSRDEIL